MTLPLAPNRTIPSSLRKGDEGWPVYGLQTGLDALNYNLTFDGDFGVRTDQAVRNFQTKQKLHVDGIAGQATQLRIISLLDVKTHNKHLQLPIGLLRGFSAAEGGNNVGAVNWHVSGGVDCGVVQIRCYGPPYKSSELYVAYDPLKAMDRVAVTFLGKVASFRGMSYAKQQPLEFAQRCAALSWNWPYAAQQYHDTGTIPNPTGVASWAPTSLPPADRTRAGWCRFYVKAMGA